MAAEGLLMPQVRLLFELDQRDRAILLLQKERDDIKAASRAARQALEDEARGIEVLEASLQAMAQQQVVHERELTETDGKVHRIDAGEVNFSRDFDAARRERVRLLERKNELEELILGAIEAQEAGARKVTAQKRDLNARKRNFSEKQAEWKERFEALGKAIEAQRAEREELLPTLTPDIRAEYDKIFNRYKDFASTRVTDGKCPPCRMAVPLQHVGEMALGKALHFCDSCKRFLMPESF